MKSKKRGLALVEAIIATLILAGVLAASMRVAAISATLQAKNAQRRAAHWLAAALASDIAALAYESPTGTPVFGRESGELANSKVNYNDVDDFDGWTESPPQNKIGVAIPGMTGYTRTVSVARAAATNLDQNSASETGVKRITITVKRGNTTLATLVFIRTFAS